MNDLSKKQEIHIEEKAKISPSNTLLKKKLESVLLLVYQGYLRGETDIETETRAAFLNLVKQDEEFALKIRMLQLDLLSLENVELEGEWNEFKDILFPIIEGASEPVAEARKKQLTDYKETISDLLESSGEFGSEA